MIRLALPAGDVRPALGRLLTEVGLPLEEYARGSRAYVAASRENGLRVRVFRERDIPIQIALGNYDLGICDAAWVEELLGRYSSEAIVPLCDLGLGKRSIYVAAAASGENAPWWETPVVRLVSEYPGLAEAFARAARLPSYRIFPVWGAAEAYPPEDAELALVATKDEDDLSRNGLRPVHRLLESSVWLVANEQSLRSKDLGRLIKPLLSLKGVTNGRPPLTPPPPLARAPGRRQDVPWKRRDNAVRLALPDGHQQRHAVAALREAGIQLSGYDEETAARRPGCSMDGVEVKVIRPQDMPQQVALGNFDLAITGRDWLLDHLYRFPLSPVREAADLHLGSYSIAAVVSEELPAAGLDEALKAWRAEGRAFIRVASEYVNVADHFARGRHLGRYKVVPISGASEGFVPEDAELLIEGTETGATLAANRLKVIERLFQSTTCLIASTQEPPGERERLVKELTGMFLSNVALKG
ncbi:MAG: ATP phosphoribosyltransferase [Dehalococcoidia bacterium]|nr:ATP phosphoribosyltransferase [Dehalococcoidia bacterium]